MNVPIWIKVDTLDKDKTQKYIQLCLPKEGIFLKWLFRDVHRNSEHRIVSAAIRIVMSFKKEIEGRSLICYNACVV